MFLLLSKIFIHLSFSHNCAICVKKLHTIPLVPPADGENCCDVFDSHLGLYVAPVRLATQFYKCSSGAVTQTRIQLSESTCSWIELIIMDSYVITANSLLRHIHSMSLFLNRNYIQSFVLNSLHVNLPFMITWTIWFSLVFLPPKGGWGVGGSNLHISWLLMKA